MNNITYKKELEVAKNLAVKVGLYLKRAQKKNKIVKQPNGEGYLDVTTDVDLESEQMIINTLKRKFPDDYILSEETMVEYSKVWKRVWIIDPLDGTTNYFKGLDTYGVSISLALNGRVMLAVSFLPVSGNLFYSIRGGGVFLNNKKLKLATPNDTLAQSLVSVGFPHRRIEEVAKKAFLLYKSLWLSSSDLRRSASAVYDGCLLASGLTGAYITPDIRPWDIASGSLFVEEQGGIVSDLNGKLLDIFKEEDGRFSTSVIFAKNKSIHESLKKVINNI